MRRPIMLVGIVVFVVGAAILVYGVQAQAGLGIQATEWTVDWYRMTDSVGGWGDIVGTTTFPADFDFDPLTYDNIQPIGFKATLEIDLPQDSVIHFTIGGDDGSCTLFVDGRSEIVLYCPDPDAQESTDLSLTAGRHELGMWYYQVMVEGDSAALFSMYCEELQSGINIAVAGGFVLFLGAIVALIGFMLKPKVK